MRIVIVALLSSTALGAAGCSEDRSEGVRATSREPDQALLQSCGARGAPVTLRTLVEVARDHGVSLDVDRRGCRHPASDQDYPDATNLGPSGLGDPSVVAAEGRVLCWVVIPPHVGNRDVEVVKYPTDEETHVGVLNVGCAVYPSDAASENEQVDRLRRALEAVKREASKDVLTPADVREAFAHQGLSLEAYEVGPGIPALGYPVGAEGAAQRVVCLIFSDPVTARGYVKTSRELKPGNVSRALRARNVAVLVLPAATPADLGRTLSAVAELRRG